jgi:lysophospholipase L1-like esterase
MAPFPVKKSGLYSSEITNFKIFIKMKKTLKFFYLPILVGLLFIASCTDHTNPAPQPNPGGVDFTSYVAVGNSLTAGYANGALYISGQKYGWANDLAKQLRAVGGNGTFRIPLMPDENGVGMSESSKGTPVLRTKFVLGNTKDCLGNISVGPVPANPNASQALLYFYLTTSVAAMGPYNNLGIPGIRVTDLFDPTLAKRNPFFGRIAYSSDDVLETYAAKVHPTFFTLWIGNNDVLGYAASGGTGTITPMDGAAGKGFKASLEEEVKYLASLTTGGIIANIPDITSVPYFNTIPYNAIVLTEQKQADMLNAGYAKYNQAMAALGLPYKIHFEIGANPMVIADKDMPLPDTLAALKIRQMKKDELVILETPVDSIKCGGWGSMKPVPDQFILTEKEIQTVKTATDQFNALMKDLADQYNLAYVDFNSIMKEIDKNGVTMNGIHFTAKYITGNLFSLDGIHLTPQGNAAVANYFIQAINKKYGTKIPEVDVSTFPAIKLPKTKIAIKPVSALP